MLNGINALARMAFAGALMLPMVRAVAPDASNLGQLVIAMSLVCAIHEVVCVANERRLGR